MKQAKKKTTRKPRDRRIQDLKFRCPACEQSFDPPSEQTAIFRPLESGEDKTGIQVCDLCAKKIDKYNVGSVQGLQEMTKAVQS